MSRDLPVARLARPQAIKTRLDQALRGVLIVLFSALVLDVLWQVISRYLLGTPASFTDEVARFAFMWLGFLSAAYVAGQDGHLAIDLLHSSLSPPAGRRLQILLRLLSFAFTSVVLVLGGALLVSTSLELGQRSPVLGIPLGLVYAVVPLAGSLCSAYLALQLLGDVFGAPPARRPDEHP